MTSVISCARVGFQYSFTRSPFRTTNCVRLFSAMAGKLSSKRAEDFVDFLNASPTRMKTLQYYIIYKFLY